MNKERYNQIDEQKKLLTEIMEADQNNGLYDHIGDVNKKVTAVEFLLDKIIKSNASKSGDVVLHGYLSNTDIEQAKQMEKEQLDKAYYQGQESKCIGGPLYTELYNK